MGTDYVAVVDPADGHVVERVHTGKGAHNLFLSPDRKIIWVNNRVGGTTTSLDAATLALIRSYAIPGGPDDIAFAPDGRLWITRRFAEKVAVLDPTDRRVPDDRCRPLAAWDVPESEGRRGAHAECLDVRADPWLIRSTSLPAGCRSIC